MSDQVNPKDPLPPPDSSMSPLFYLRTLRASLVTTFRDTLFLHLASLCVGLFSAQLFSRLLSSHSLSSLSRRLLSLFFFFYYPALTLAASLALCALHFLRRQTRTVETFLHSLCDTLAQPVLRRLPTHGAKPEEVRQHVQQSADDVIKGDKGDKGEEGRSFLSRMALKIVLKVVTMVAGVRLEEAAAQGVGGVVTAANVAQVLGGGMVGAVVGPVKKTVAMYLGAVVVGGVVLYIVPLWMVK